MYTHEGRTFCERVGIACDEESETTSGFYILKYLEASVWFETL